MSTINNYKPSKVRIVTVNSLVHINSYIRSNTYYIGLTFLLFILYPKLRRN